MLKYLFAIFLLFVFTVILIFMLKPSYTSISEVAMKKSDLKSFLTMVAERGTSSPGGRETEAYMPPDNEIRLIPLTATPDENGHILVRTEDDEISFPIEATALILVYKGGGNMMTPWPYDSHYRLIPPDEFEKSWPLAFQLLQEHNYYPDWEICDFLIHLRRGTVPYFLCSGSEIIIRNNNTYQPDLIAGIDYRGVYIYRPLYEDNRLIYRDYKLRRDFHTLPPHLEEIRLRLMLLNTIQAADYEDESILPAYRALMITLFKKFL